MLYYFDLSDLYIQHLILTIIIIAEEYRIAQQWIERTDGHKGSF